MILILLLIFFLFPINFEIKTDKKQVKLGELFNVEIKVPSDKNIKIRGIEKLSDSIHIFKKKIKGNKIRLKLGIYQLGKVEIPLKIYLVENNKPRELKIPSFTISVSSSIKPINTIRPIKNVSGYFNPVWLIVIFFIIVFLYFHFKKKHKKKEKREFISVEDWFDSKLNEIKRIDYPSKGKFKEYYDALSDLLREYIQKKYSIKTMELTSEELFKVLKNSFSNDLYLKLRAIFTECDWIKFTPLGKKPESIERVFEEIRNLAKNGF